MPKCSNCDSENKENAKFCIYCGKPLPYDKSEALLQKEGNASKIPQASIKSISTRLFITAIGISLALTFFSVVYISYLKNQEEIVIPGESALPTKDIAITDSLQAGQNVESVKFKMISATVQFYETDTVAFKRVKVFIPNCEVNEYKCLLAFCKENELIGVEERIHMWAGIKCETINDLRLFRDTITHDLVKIKEYRKYLPSYKDYLQQLDSLVADLRNNDTTYKLTAGYNSIRPYKATSFNEYDMIIRLTWIAFLIGLIGIALSIWFYFRKVKAISSNFK